MLVLLLRFGNAGDTDEKSDGFIGVVSMILLMLPASRTRRKTAKNDLKNGWWLLHKPSKTQNLPPNFCQFLIFALLRSTKFLFTPGFRVVNHPLSNNQPPIGQRLGTFGGPIVTSKVSNAFTHFRTKFTPLPWPMSYNLCTF